MLGTTSIVMYVLTFSRADYHRLLRITPIRYVNVCLYTVMHIANFLGSESHKGFANILSNH